MVQQRLCLTCSTPFEVPPTSKRRWCSPACQPREVHSTRPRPDADVECAYCGESFKRKAWKAEKAARSGWEQFCSVQCRDAAKRGRRGQPKAQRVTLTCEQCGAPFEVPPWEARKGRRFCSASCSGTAAGKKGGRPAWGVLGRRTITNDGYALTYVPPEDRPDRTSTKTRYLEHRYVMSKVLGRWPESHETVHHINGNKLDNRAENLQLRNGKHSPGYVLRCRCCGSSDIEHVELA